MGMNDFTPGYSDEYLAHSKGPWKKHKYVSVVNGRYIYPHGSSVRGARAVSKGSAGVRYTTTSGGRAANRGSGRVMSNAEASRAARSGRASTRTDGNSNTVNNTGLRVRSDKQLTRAARKGYRKTKVANLKYDVSEAASKVAGAAKRTGAQLKNKAHSARYLAKAYGDKAHFAALDARKAAKKAKDKATAYGRKASYKAKRAARKAYSSAKLTTTSVAKRGKNAIQLLNAKYKGYQGKRRMQKIKKKVAKARK